LAKIAQAYGKAIKGEKLALDGLKHDLGGLNGSFECGYTEYH